MQSAQYIKLSKEAIDVLLTRKVNLEQSYNTYPTSIDDDIYTTQEIRNVCDKVLNELKFGKGYAVVSARDAALTDSHDIRIAYWNLFTCLAEPLAQFNTGDYLHNVQKSDETPPARCSFSMTDKVAEIHTDGSYLYNVPPHFIGLICLYQAELGGESILVDGREVLRQLKRECPEVISCLKQNYHFNTDNQLEDSKTLYKPIIAENDSTIIINYNRIHIESGHRVIELPLTNESKDSMNKLDFVLNSKENQDLQKLKSSEMLILNNHYMLHGRKSFNDSKNVKRLFIRVWGNDR